MSTEYTINNTTKWGMLILALLFDIVQFMTPSSVDTLITAFAALVFGMIFLEKGALTVQNAQQGLKILRLIIPFVELFVSILPGITLEVWVMIKISRLADRVLPKTLHTTLAGKQSRVHKKNIVKAQHTIKQTRKYIYGKGRRGARTLARKTKQRIHTKK